MPDGILRVPSKPTCALAYARAELACWGVRRRQWSRKRWLPMLTLILCLSGARSQTVEGKRLRGGRRGTLAASQQPSWFRQPNKLLPPQPPLGLVYLPRQRAASLAQRPCTIAHALHSSTMSTDLKCDHAAACGTSIRACNVLQRTSFFKACKRNRRLGSGYYDRWVRDLHNAPLTPKHRLGQSK